MKSRYLLWVSVCTLATGCGGGGSSQSTDTSGTVREYGFITTRAAGAVNPPVIMGSGAAVMTGVYGASFTSVALNLPPLGSLPPNEAIAQTSIVVSNYNRPFIYDCGTSELNPVGPVQSFIDDCAPSVSGTGTRLAASQIDPDNRISVYTMAPDGTGKTLVASVAGDYTTQTAFSPNGKTILFGTFISERIYSVSANGGTPTPLTPVGAKAANPAWSPDGTKIVYSLYNPSTGKYEATMMNANGTESAVIPFSSRSDSPVFLSWVPGTPTLIETHSDGATFKISRLNPGSYCVPIISGPDPVIHASMAPTGDRFVYQKSSTDAGIYIHNMDTNEDAKVASSQSFVNVSPSWGPYMQSRVLVGSGAPFGASIGAFIYGQLGSRVTSVVGIDATTRSTIQVVPQANTSPYQTVTVCTVSADSIKYLRYMNDLKGWVTSVVGPSSPVSGAVISFDANKGKVVTIATYVGTVAPAGNSLSYKGRFIGVWNSKGENVAPNGVSQLTLDSVTGIPVSLR